MRIENKMWYFDKDRKKITKEEGDKLQKRLKKMSNKDEVRWMPYQDYITEQYFIGRASEEEYKLAQEYIKDKTKKDKTFKEWLEEKQKT